MCVGGCGGSSHLGREGLLEVASKKKGKSTIARAAKIMYVIRRKILGLLTIYLNNYNVNVIIQQ